MKRFTELRAELPIDWRVSAQCAAVKTPRAAASLKTLITSMRYFGVNVGRFGRGSSESR